MIKSIEVLKQTRQLMFNLVSDLTTDQVNDTPFGFNNNIVWNIAHVLSTQQGICYKRAGVPMIIEESFFADYKGGTKPERYVDNEEFEMIKQKFITAPDQLNEDINKGLFSNYETWSTRLGITITNIEDAITFLVFHEGLHLGYTMALKRLVLKN